MIRYYLSVARTLSPREIVVKGGQKIWRDVTAFTQQTYAQFFGTHLSEKDFYKSLREDLRDRTSLLKFLRTEAAQPFFFAPHQRPSAVAAIRSLSAAVQRDTLALADRTCAHVFDLLGSGEVNLGNAIDWHTDYKTGHRYPPKGYYKTISPALYPGGHDIKVPWELSRFQPAVWLGEAYWLTDDEKYAQEFVLQVSSWLAHNPPRIGVNWACTMDVAIRVANWLWAYQMVRHSPLISDDFLLMFQYGLLEHGRHIRANLEVMGEETGNHYLADLVGLIYLGICCPHFIEAQEWREFGLHELWRELERQVSADGVNFESSVSYHRLACELFLYPLILCEQQNIAVPPNAKARIEKMLEYVLHYSHPDGSVPLIGDSDDGRLHRLKAWGEREREWVDHRYLLALGAMIFKREDFARAAGDEWVEACWVFGESAVEFKRKVARGEAASPVKSRAFAQGGMYSLRRGNFHLVVSASKACGHAHNDALGFEFWAGQTWIVDAGSYVYTADYKARNEFRAARAHNVLVLNESEPNRFDEQLLFTMPQETQVTVHEFSETKLSVSHNGYARLGATVQREFELQANQLMIKDLIETSQLQKFATYFHFEPQVEVSMNGLSATLTAGAQRLTFEVQTSADIMLNVETGWVSRSYGRRESAQVLVVRGDAAQNLNLTYKFKL